MARETARRESLAEAATDYVLEHGLLGLSLRPLAAALGTSDRILLYHFESKDDLVATVMRVSNDRAIARIDRLPAASGPAQAVLELWAAVREEPLERCQTLYVQAAALGLLGREPYAAVVREANGRWTAALAAHLVRAGVHEAAAARAVVLVDAALMGLELDFPLLDPSDCARAVEDLAAAVATMAARKPMR